MTTIKSLYNNHTLYFDKITDTRVNQDHWKMVVYYNMSIFGKHDNSEKLFVNSVLIWLMIYNNL